MCTNTQEQAHHTPHTTSACTNIPLWEDKQLLLKNSKLQCCFSGLISLCSGELHRIRCSAGQRGWEQNDWRETCSRNHALPYFSHPPRQTGLWHSALAGSSILPHLCCACISPQVSICPKQCGYQETRRHCVPHGHLTDIKWGARRIVGSVFISFSISAGRTPGFLVSLFSTLHKIQRTFPGAGGVAFASLQAAVALWCEW